MPPTSRNVRGRHPATIGFLRSVACAHSGRRPSRVVSEDRATGGPRPLGFDAALSASPALCWCEPPGRRQTGPSVVAPAGVQAFTARVRFVVNVEQTP